MPARGTPTVPPAIAVTAPPTAGPSAHDAVRTRGIAVRTRPAEHVAAGAGGPSSVTASVSLAAKRAVVLDGDGKRGAGTVAVPSETLTGTVKVLTSSRVVRHDRHAQRASPCSRRCCRCTRITSPRRPSRSACRCRRRSQVTVSAARGQHRAGIAQRNDRGSPSASVIEIVPPRSRCWWCRCCRWHRHWRRPALPRKPSRCRCRPPEHRWCPWMVIVKSRGLRRRRRASVMV